MSNDVTRQPIDLYEKYAAEAAVMYGPRLKFVKGTYKIGDEVVALNTEFVALMADVAQCWARVLDWVRMKTEDKTGFELAIPVHPELRQIIDATPSKHLTLLVTELGAPFTAAGFGNWFRDRCNEAGLKHCAFHGLRKAAATRLIDAGCDVVEAAAITGHASLKELQRYIETRDRRKARRAIDKLISGTEVDNPIIRLANQEKKA
jgi:integrase